MTSKKSKSISNQCSEARPSGTSVAPSTTKHFVPKRSQLIISPNKTKHTKTKIPRKTARRKGKQLFLNFVEFPLDIIYEIANYLHPRDLLNLGRVSKDFRAFFLSRATAYVWRRTLNKDNLPLCPEDLCEPEYASLLFDAFCMACGSTRASLTTDYNLRLRFCAACTKLNICTGRAYINCVDSDSEVLMLIPAGLKNILSYQANDTYSSKRNVPKLTYFKPELNALHDKFSELKGKAARAFSAKQIEVATRMMHEGFAMKAWEESMELAKQREAQDRMNNRVIRMKEEMLKVGWEEKYFPTIGDKQEETYVWNKFMYTPVEFTMEEWEHIFPLMETLYYFSKTQKQAGELIERSAFRYIQFRSEKPLETKRLMPGVKDFAAPGNFWFNFIMENYQDCSEANLDTFMPEIVENTQDFLPKVKSDLVDMILEHDPSQPRDPEILNKAANLFLCGCSSCWAARENMDLKVVKPYPEVIHHVLAGDDIIVGMVGWTAQKICVDPLILQASRDILEVLGLSPDCTRDEVAKLGKLECRCGHHAYSDVALTFEQLAEHTFQERKWNQRMEKNVADESKHLVQELLQDGHSLDFLKTLIGFAPADMEIFDEKAYYDQERDIWGRVIPTVYPPDLPCPHLCRSCYRLTLLSWPYRDGAAHYHVKTKHGRDRQDDDFEPRHILVDEYGGDGFNEVMATGCHIPISSFT